MATDNSDLTRQLIKLIGKAVADVGSQSKRIPADLKLAGELGATLAADGVLNDRWYIVSCFG
jgi:hypothetical protein